MNERMRIIHEWLNEETPEDTKWIQEMEHNLRLLEPAVTEIMESLPEEQRKTLEVYLRGIREVALYAVKKAYQTGKK